MLERPRERGFGVVADLQRDDGDRGLAVAHPIGAELHAPVDQYCMGRMPTLTMKPLMHGESKEVAPVSRDTPLSHRAFQHMIRPAPEPRSWACRTVALRD